MIDFRRHLIPLGSTIRRALEQLNDLALDAILFVVHDDGRLVGSLTDGDVRRGFLRGLGFDHYVEDFIQPNPKYFVKGDYDISQVIDLRTKNYRVVPVVDREMRILNIINFRFLRSYLPVDAVIMAGGRGERLKPLTDTTPKPLLKVADKPIIDYNIDRLASFGIDDYWISVRYLADKLMHHLKDGSDRRIRIDYVLEDAPMGTIGAVSKISGFRHEYVLVTNSDILTDLDYEDFFIEFLKSGAELSVVTIPYHVNVPYAVLEMSGGQVMNFKEKPTYTFYSNGGIYLMKRSVVELIPKEERFDATDLLSRLISGGRKVHSYPLRGYWLDIGKPEDFAKAQDDVKHLRL